MCPCGYLISAYRGVTSSTRVVIANLIVSDHRDIFQELDRNPSYVHCLFPLEEHLHFLKYFGGKSRKIGYFYWSNLENTEFLRISDTQGGFLLEKRLNKNQQCKSKPTTSGVGGSTFERNVRM